MPEGTVDTTEVTEEDFLQSSEGRALSVKLLEHLKSLVNKGKVEYESKETGKRKMTKSVKVLDPTNGQEIYIGFRNGEEIGVGSYWLNILKKQGNTHSSSIYLILTAGFEKLELVAIDRSLGELSDAQKTQMDQAYQAGQLMTKWRTEAEPKIQRAAVLNNPSQPELKGLVDFAQRIASQGEAVK